MKYKGEVFEEKNNNLDVHAIPGWIYRMECV